MGSVSQNNQNNIYLVNVPIDTVLAVKLLSFPNALADLWYQMFLPPGFSESKKYPLLIDV